MDLQLAKILAIQNSLFPVQSSPAYVTSVFTRTELAQSHCHALQTRCSYTTTSSLPVPLLTLSFFASHLPHTAYTLTCEATRSVDRGIYPDIRNEPCLRTMRGNLSFLSICISQYSFRRLMQVARKNMRISLKTNCFSDGMCRRTARDVN
jgi:hypothetical protein